MTKSEWILLLYSYLDNILVYSDNKEQHQKDLDKVFSILNENFKIALGKCIFNVTKFKFLEFNLSKEEFLPANNKIQEMKSFQYPKDFKSLCRFLGIIGFYRKLMSNYAVISSIFIQIYRDRKRILR